MSAPVIDIIAGLPVFLNRADLPCQGADVNPDLFFPGRCDDADAAEAVALCGRCDVRVDCLTYATQTRQRFGIWAGTTPAERGWPGKTEPDPDREHPRPVEEGAELAFTAARALVAGAASGEVMVRFGVCRTALSEAAAVLRHAPHLVDAVLTGGMSRTEAIRRAVAVRRAGRVSARPPRRRATEKRRTAPAELYAGAREVVGGSPTMEVAHRLGVSRGTVLRAVMVVRAAPHLVDAVIAGTITRTAAEAAARTAAR